MPDWEVINPVPANFNFFQLFLSAIGRAWPDLPSPYSCCLFNSSSSKAKTSAGMVFDRSSCSVFDRVGQHLEIPDLGQFPAEIPVKNIFPVIGAVSYLVPDHPQYGTDPFHAFPGLVDGFMHLILALLRLQYNIMELFKKNPVDIYAYAFRIGYDESIHTHRVSLSIDPYKIYGICG